MDKVLNMTYESSLTDLCEVNSSFDTGVLRVCYTGQNRNNSYISKEAILKSMKTLYNCPVVCNYDRESDTLGGHDMEIVRDADDSLRLINLTTPVGVIPESAKVWFEDYEEEDGTVHEYLYTEVLLWKRQEAYRKIRKDGITAHSMEIRVINGQSVDGVYHVYDFEFTAFALIGVDPCFESSALELFAHTNFKQQMAEMMQDIKETFHKDDPSQEVDHTNLEEYSMEGGKKVLDEKIIAAAELGVDNESAEELKEKFDAEEVVAEEAPAEEAPVEEEAPAEEAPEEDAPAEEASEEEPSEEDTFALTSNTIDELRRSLTVEVVTDGWGTHPRYYYVDADLDQRMIYAWDAREDWLLYGFSYSVDGDAVAIDFESKKRMKYEIVEFDEGEQDSPVADVFEMFSARLAELADADEKFNTASDTIKSLETELDELRQFKTDTENAIAASQREEVFAQFEDLIGIEAFDELRNNCEQYDTATLEEKCFALRGRYGTNGMTFSEKGKAPKLFVGKADLANESDEPYGGLFLEYSNKGSE